MQSATKTLEVKVRAVHGTERSDQKDLARVFLSRDALLDLGLEPGQPCSLSKIDEKTTEIRGAVAWLTSQKLNKNVMQMFKSFQELCGFRLEDRVMITPAGALDIATKVVLEDNTDGNPLSAKDWPHWEWFLEDKLSRAENIFPGMAFELSLKGPKRAFKVTSVLSGEDKCALGLFGESSTAQIKGGGWAVVETFTKPTLSAPLVIADFSGIDKALEKLNGFLAFVAQDRTSGMRVQPCGVLIHGSPGTGKTLILQKLAETRWGKVFRIDRSMKLSNIKDIFTQAVSEKPSMILIDDLDVMVAREHSQASAVETALCDAMATLIPYVLVAATASSLTDVPRTLRKAGKFEVDILLSVPGADDRKEILKSISPLLAEDSALLEHVVDQTHAYTAEDLQLLLNEVGRTASGRLRKSESEEVDEHAPMLKEDIDKSLLLVRATAMHDVTLEPPKIHWDDIGGQNAVKKALRYAVETPRLYPELMAKHGRVPKKGILLYGPPGCSKTLSAQAMATEISHNFLAVKGAELLNMYVGESERAVRTIFSRARAAAPSIIFFDEIESIGAKREARSNSGVNVLTTLLNEMDGIEALKGVTVLAATNKPELLDEALLRPGRFDVMLYVAPPDQKGREEILKVQMKKMFVEDNLDIPMLANEMAGFSGAEVVNTCQVALDGVIEKCVDSGNMDLKVGMEDFINARKSVVPQITEQMLRHYQKWAAERKGLSS